MHPLVRLDFARVNLAVSFACLVALAIGIYLVARDQSDSDRSVAQTQRVINHVAELQQLALDAESTGRAYMLTADPAIAERYVSLMRAVDREHAVLGGLVSDARDARELTDVRETIARRFGYVERLMDVRRREGLAETARAAAQGVGRTEMAHVREALSELRNTQDARLRERLDRRDRAMQRLRAFTAVAVLAGILFVAWLYRATERSDVMRQARERQTRHMAYHDPLTGLPNRRYLQDRLQRFVRAARGRGERATVMYLDLDGFKDVNDGLGHEAGDELLVDVARRLRHSVREDDVVARLGGDEFGLLLPGLHSQADVEFVASKLVQVLGEPYVLAAGRATVSTSIGIALYPEDAGEPRELLDAADGALYAAKSAGKNQFKLSAERRRA